MASSPAVTVDISQAMVMQPVAALDWLIIMPVVLPLFAGAILLMLRSKPQWHERYAIGVMSIQLLASGGLLFHVLQHGPRTMTMGRWLPPFGISFSADILGSLLTVTGSLIALICIIHSKGLISNQLKRNGFYVFIILMMGGVSGAFITGDIFNMYVWFEVLLISSFGLIICGGEKLQIDGAVKYTFLNLIATTLFLIATGLLYGAVGTLNMADISLSLENAEARAPINTIALLYFVAFGMKAAAFPLNFWLPASYHTPRLVVSALFAGLLTKVGVYALMRTMIMLFAGQMDAFSLIIAGVAALTMLLGVMGAIAQNDIRRIAGYLVISGIGSMVAGIALASEMSLAGTVLYAVHSMLAMTALYLVISVIGMRSGTYDLRELGGLYAVSPMFAAGFAILAFAICGLPPFSGFWPKYLLVNASLNVGNWWIAAAILVTGFLSTIAMFRIWIYAFWRGGPLGTKDGGQNPKIKPLSREIQLTTYVGIGVLITLVVMIGTNPDWIIGVSLEAGKGLIYPDPYIQSVFGGEQ